MPGHLAFATQNRRAGIGSRGSFVRLLSIKLAEALFGWVLVSQHAENLDGGR